MSSIPLILERAMRANGQSLRVAMPARVVAYDATTRLADIQIVLDETLEEGDVLKQPVIFDAPVMFAGGGGGALTFPLNVGDEGLAVFADRDISGWVAGTPTAKDGERQHSLNDAMFFPCFTTPSASPTSATLTFAGTSITINPDGGVLIVPANGTASVTGNLAVSGAITAATATIAGIAFASHVHPHGSGHGTTGAPE